MSPWSTPPLTLALGVDEIHIWRADLNRTQAEIDKLRCTLSEEERQRAQRFHFDRDRQHFIAGRGLLRNILGRYLQRDPHQIQFAYSPRGKPSLIPPDALEFNLSHSQGMALYGVTRSRPLGIDLEYIRPMPKVEQLARRFFCEGEYKKLTALPAEKQAIAFFNGWTRKEAYLKATGEGLVGLQGVEVSLIPEELPSILHLDGDRTSEGWSLYHLTPYPNYVGALAIEAQNLRLSHFDFSSAGETI